MNTVWSFTKFKLLLHVITGYVRWKRRKKNKSLVQYAWEIGDHFSCFRRQYELKFEGATLLIDQLLDSSCCLFGEILLRGLEVSPGGWNMRRRGKTPNPIFPCDVENVIEK